MVKINHSSNTVVLGLHIIHSLSVSGKHQNYNMYCCWSYGICDGSNQE
jgi:hypothetical protein